MLGPAAKETRFASGRNWRNSQYHSPHIAEKAGCGCPLSLWIDTPSFINLRCSISPKQTNPSDWAKVQALFEAGADVYWATERGDSLLHLTIKTPKIIEILHTHNAGVSTTDGRNAPLDVAALAGHEEILKMLMDAQWKSKTAQGGKEMLHSSVAQ